MNRKIMNLWLMAALVCGLSMSVASCKDDDDNPGGEPETEEQAATVSKFWSVVGQLVSSDDYTVDYEDKTFEPVYGIADATNETTRIVETNDMRTAASCFADLVGASDIDENTPSYTYSDPEVGTLTYTRGGTAEDWATVDVSIKQVPRLRKIIYRVGGEGTNASFREKAWYRFGDVVSRQNQDGQTEYWICVRPAFGPEKKSDSHWVCLNTVPQKNLFHVNGSNGTQYYVPTGVGTNTKRMQDLAEMLYAMVYPEKWYETATNNHTDGLISFSGVPIFTDFTKANLMYHNQHFWKRVTEGWMKKGIADKALNTKLENLADRIEQEGITLLYEGYSWWSKTSWNCKLYQASYTNGTSYDEKNLHHAVYTKPEKNMKSIKFDCRTMGDEMSNYQDFFGDTKLRWVIRHATGKELNGGSQPAPTSRLQGGCTDVYRYYDEYPDQAEKSGPKGNDDIGPEVADPFSNEPQDIPAKVGALVGLDGKFYENKAKCEAAGTQPVAMVVYLSTDGHRVEKGQPWTGLALALADEPGTDGSGNYKWTDAGPNRCMDLCTTAVDGGRRTDEGNDGDVETDYRSFALDGWAMTKRMAQHECFNHSHPAAEAAWSTANRPAGFSEWFMPSIGQWILALKGMGYERQYTSRYMFSLNDYSWNFKDNGKWLWQEAGVPEAALKSGYASTSQTCAYPNQFYTYNGSLGFEKKGKYEAKYHVRRMIAFGDGATIDPPTFPHPIEPRPGAIITLYGTCFSNMDDLKVFQKETDAKGMVVYYSKTKRVEAGLDYNGLVIGLKDYLASEWCTNKNAATSECSVAVGGAADYATAIAGGAISELLAQGVDGHEHPAASRSRENMSNMSKGFLPSAGQWILAKQGLGYTWSTDGMGHFNTAGKWPWVEAGLAQYATADVAEYWTSTEQKDGDTYKVLAVSPNGVTFKLHDKTDKLLVRPFFAFGHWGTED